MTNTLTPEILLEAYAKGIFPMSEARDSDEIFWVKPRLRGIIPLNNFHISRSLARALRKTSFQVQFDTAFLDIVKGCADRPETWINGPIIKLYKQLFNMGHAHSVEIRDGDTLVGGTYGVALGGAFFAESMFSRQPNTSKMALAWLVDRLKTGGFTLIDTQFLTPHLQTLGGIEISSREYDRRLRNALKIDADFNRATDVPTGYCVLQRNGQTS